MAALIILLIVLIIGTVVSSVTSLIATHNFDHAMKQIGFEDATKVLGLEDVSKQIQDFAEPMIEAAQTAVFDLAVEAEKAVPQDST